jgi:hypothetical protein
MNGPSRHFVKESDFVTRTITGETIIVPIRGGVGDLDAIYTLNEVGTRIWKLIDERMGAPEIAEVIGREYEVPPEEAAGDTLGFLDSLKASGLIRQAPEPPETSG